MTYFIRFSYSLKDEGEFITEVTGNVGPFKTYTEAENYQVVGADTQVILNMREPVAGAMYSVR